MEADGKAKVFLSAAEVSGDRHAGNLAAALTRKLPGVTFAGIGGARMAEASCELLADTTERAAMLTGPLAQMGYYRRLIRQVSDYFRAERPDVFVPVDSPALNWHLCRAARKHGVPIVHYVAPQLWAWGPWRIGKLRKLTDHVACLLPFEPEYFRRRGVPATFVGHPMFDHLPPRARPFVTPPSDGAWRILLLPGSRKSEIVSHAAAMAGMSTQLRRRFPRATFTFAAPDDRSARLIADSVGRACDIRTGRTHKLMDQAHFAVVASGTATLETAYFGLPMVVVYHVPPLTFRALGWMLTTPHISLVNIVAGKRLVPELVPFNGRAGTLTNAVSAQLADLARLEAVSRELVSVTETVRPPGGISASESAAKLVLRVLRGQ